MHARGKSDRGKVSAVGFLLRSISLRHEKLREGMSTRLTRPCMLTITYVKRLNVKCISALHDTLLFRVRRTRGTCLHTGIGILQRGLWISELKYDNTFSAFGHLQHLIPWSKIADTGRCHCARGRKYQIVQHKRYNDCHQMRR